MQNNKLEHMKRLSGFKEGESMKGTAMCSKCGRKIQIEEVKKFVNKVKVASLFSARCDKCRHTIFSDSMEEMTR